MCIVKSAICETPRNPWKKDRICKCNTVNWKDYKVPFFHTTVIFFRAIRSVFFLLSHYSESVFSHAAAMHCLCFPSLQQCLFACQQCFSFLHQCIFSCQQYSLPFYRSALPPLSSVFSSSLPLPMFILLELLCSVFLLWYIYIYFFSSSAMSFPPFCNIFLTFSNIIPFSVVSASLSQLPYLSSTQLCLSSPQLCRDPPLVGAVCALLHDLLSPSHKGLDSQNYLLNCFSVQNLLLFWFKYFPFIYVCVKILFCLDLNYVLRLWLWSSRHPCCTVKSWLQWIPCCVVLPVELRLEVLHKCLALNTAEVIFRTLKMLSADGLGAIEVCTHPAYQVLAKLASKGAYWGIFP